MSNEEIANLKQRVFCGVCFGSPNPDTTEEIMKDFEKLIDEYKLLRDKNG